MVASGLNQESRSMTWVQPWTSSWNSTRLKRLTRWREGFSKKDIDTNLRKQNLSKTGKQSTFAVREMKPGILCSLVSGKERLSAGFCGAYLCAIDSKRGAPETGGVAEGRFPEGAQLGLNSGRAEALAVLLRLGRQFAFRLRFSIEHLGVAVSGTERHQLGHAHEEHHDRGEQRQHVGCGCNSLSARMNQPPRHVSTSPATNDQFLLNFQRYGLGRLINPPATIAPYQAKSYLSKRELGGKRTHPSFLAKNKNIRVNKTFVEKQHSAQSLRDTWSHSCETQFATT